MFQDSKFARDLRGQVTGPDGTAVGNLRHVVEMFADHDPTDFVLIATSRIYPPGPGVYETASGVTRTGLLHNDLRELLKLVSGSEGEIEEDEDGAPYPDVAQGSHPAAVVLRSILDRHRIGSLDVCETCRTPWPCDVVGSIVSADVER